MADQQRDEVVVAVDALTDVLERNAGDERLLSRKLSQLRRATVEGRPLTATLEAEQDPAAMQVLGRVLARLMDASGHFRRAVARGMRAEGTSIPAIAKLFGVTHQRVSNILSRPAGPPAVPAPALHEVGTVPGERGDEAEEVEA
ncbi:MAG: hypothetical protein ACYDA2_03260 [Acidimicrobiales bacterium]